MGSLFGKNTSAPPAPDYTGAAKATAEGNIDTARLATKANRVNYNTPYGNLYYTQNPNDQDLWTANVNLSPEQQQLLNAQNQSSIGLANLQSGAVDRVSDSFGQPFDYSSVQDVADKAYGNYTSRLDPQWTQRQGALETQLANQGIARGTEAYTNAMRDFGNQRNDAYTQAQTASFNLMPQTYQLAAALRSQPLNELNALRTGSQVTNPTFQNSPQQATTQGPDMLSAANAQYSAALGGYNANQAQQANMMNGLFNLGSAYLMSDRRLKTEIKQVGKLNNGLNVYQYRYKFGGPIHLGVMADEVEQVSPCAVATHSSGYKMVDYSKVM